MALLGNMPAYYIKNYQKEEKCMFIILNEDFLYDFSFIGILFRP